MNYDDYLPTRHSLINRLKDWGDQDSWVDFFDTYWRYIYGLARKAGLSDDEAQDVVQETVIGIAKKIKDFQCSPNHSFKAYLTNATKYRIGDRFRKRKKGATSSASNSEETDGTAHIERIPDPRSLEIDREWEMEWEQNLLEVALEKVRQRVDNQSFQLFHQHVVKQWPAKKVAESSGAKLAEVYFAKYKVSRLLKREIQRLQKELI